MNIIEQEKLLKKRRNCETTYMFKYPDEWGYFTNLHHSVVRKEYENFRKQRMIPSFAPLSDDERHEFDCILANKYKEEWTRWQNSFLKNLGGKNARKTIISAADGLENCEADSA